VRALSVQQPWAYAILHGKDVENRDWKGFPAVHLHTVIALHASQPDSKRQFESDRADIHRISGGRIVVPPLPELPVKAVVGVFRVREGVRHSDSPWFNGSLLALVLDDVRAFREAISWNGSLGLWEVPGAVYNAMREQAGAGGLIRQWKRPQTSSAAS
jgi:hypothetical protein